MCLCHASANNAQTSPPWSSPTPGSSPLGHQQLSKQRSVRDRGGIKQRKNKMCHSLPSNLETCSPASLDVENPACCPCTRSAGNLLLRKRVVRNRSTGACESRHLVLRKFCGTASLGLRGWTPAGPRLNEPLTRGGPGDANLDKTGRTRSTCETRRVLGCNQTGPCAPLRCRRSLFLQALESFRPLDIQWRVI